MTMALVLLAGVHAQHEMTSLYPVDVGEAPTWCSYATCNPQYSASLGWNTGDLVLERTCESTLPPHDMTFVDTFDITLWLASARDGVDTIQLELFMENGTVVQTVQTEVGFTRTRTTLRAPSAPTTVQWWVRLMSPPGKAFLHSFYYEMVLSRHDAPPPADLGNLACIGRGSDLCQTAGYRHSSACAFAPSPPQTCGDDCSCDCCLPAEVHIRNSGRASSRACPGRAHRSFRAGAAAQCVPSSCAARFYDCPSEGFNGTNEAAYVAVPACDGSTSAPAGANTSPPPPISFGVGRGIGDEAILGLAATSAALASCVVGLCVFLLWVRRREQHGEPVWTAFDAVVTPHPNPPQGTATAPSAQPSAGASSSSRGTQMGTEMRDTPAPCAATQPNEASGVSPTTGNKRPPRLV